MRFGEEWSGATTTTASSMNWSRECGGGGAVNRSVSADALTEAMMSEGGGAAATGADELTAASDSELPTAIGRAMNGGGADATRGGGGQNLVQPTIRHIISPVFARARDF